MDYETAKKINELMLDYGAKLGASIHLLDPANEKECKAYKLAVGKVMAEMLLEIMNPLYLKYPDLKPKELN